MSKEEKKIESIIAPQATELVFYNYRNRPPKVKMCSIKPSKVQESPLDAKSPQELMDKHGMYIDKPSLKELKPFYADLTQFQSYEQSLNSVRDIKEKFMSLDVSIRAKFNHNPEEFCKYLTSKDFDIKEIMTSDIYEQYKNDLERNKRLEEYNLYLKSDDYKKEQEEMKLRRQYEEEQYEEWKKKFKTT